jgi:hypothetical protein
MKTDIAKLVNRFLGWPLPKTFAPDCGISFDGRKPDARGFTPSWPTGTNLFTANEAHQMFEHALGAEGTNTDRGVDLIAAERAQQKYCYSTNEEEYRGEFDSREEALAEARMYKDEGHVWTGVIKPAMSFLRRREDWIAGWTVEQLDESLCDEIAADDCIIKLEPERVEELGKLILDFLDEHATFTRWGVGDVQEHEAATEHGSDAEY